MKTKIALEIPKGPYANCNGNFKNIIIYLSLEFLHQPVSFRKVQISIKINNCKAFNQVSTNRNFWATPQDMINSLKIKPQNTQGFEGHKNSKVGSLPCIDCQKKILTFGATLHFHYSIQPF